MCVFLYVHRYDAIDSPFSTFFFPKTIMMSTIILQGIIITRMLDICFIIGTQTKKNNVHAWCYNVCVFCVEAGYIDQFKLGS